MVNLSIEDFDFNLPENLIAQFPLENRTASRLLKVDATGSDISHGQFSDITDWLQKGDLLVFNNTRVIPARLFGQKASGGKVEMLFERLVSDQVCLSHVRSSRSPKVGTRLIMEPGIEVEVTGREDALFELTLVSASSWVSVLEAHGHMPLPPYMQREDDASDRERYQTVYAEHIGAVAAPTAGLHFDNNILEQLSAKGVEKAFVTLHVGAGTFQPVKVDKIEDHVMHQEWLEVTEQVVKKVQETKARGGRVFAVGTTSVRSLETAAKEGELAPFAGDTDIFIYPGYQFKVIDGLITNFHLPKSTLIMLVSALAGKDLIMRAYETAIEEQYRFYSYGDAMFINTKSVESV